MRKRIQLKKNLVVRLTAVGLMLTCLCGCTAAVPGQKGPVSQQNWGGKNSMEDFVGVINIGPSYAFDGESCIISGGKKALEMGTKTIKVQLII